MSFPTFFLDIKNIEYTMSRDGLCAIYSYQKQRQLFRIEKMFFDPDGK